MGGFLSFLSVLFVFADVGEGFHDQVWMPSGALCPMKLFCVCLVCFQRPIHSLFPATGGIVQLQKLAVRCAELLSALQWHSSTSGSVRRMTSIGQSTIAEVFLQSQPVPALSVSNGGIREGGRKVGTWQATPYSRTPTED